MVREKRSKSSSRRLARHSGRRSQGESATVISQTESASNSPPGTGGAYLSKPFHLSAGGRAAGALLDVAKMLFSKKGYDGTSVKELSDAASVNISLVSYHFGGKEGLYRACLEQFGKQCSAQSANLLQGPKSAEEYKLRLGLFIEFMMDTFTQEPELSQLAFKESDLETAFMKDIFRDSFLGVFKAIVHFFSEAQQRGLIGTAFDSHTLSSLFFGSLSHFARMDKVALEYFGRSVRDQQVRAKVVRHLKQLYSPNQLTLAES